MARLKDVESSGPAGWRPAAMMLLILAGVAGGVAQAQFMTQDPWSGEQEFLSREYYPLWTERYENYSLLSYRDYGMRLDQPTYDLFGTYLVDGQDILRVSEYRTLSPNKSSSASWSLGQFRNMVIMRDTYRNWGARFMMGNLLEGSFTPLTLNLARLEGFRWDASSYRNRFSVVVSRVPRPLSDTRYFTHYLYGGHWESRLGDVITFGASYVNLHLRDAGQRKGGLGGQVPTRLEGTDEYYVVVSDDSPGDGCGVRVFDIQALADGARLDLTPEVRVVPEVVGVDYVDHIRRDGAWAPQIPTADRLLKDKEGLFVNYGIPVSMGAAPLEVGGTDLLVFRFEIPGAPERLRFRLQVAGDYSIDVGAIYGFTGGGASRWSDWHNVRRAPGNVRDGSNLDWVEVDYGFPTGIAQYGGNASVRLFGAVLDAEYVENVGNFQFPFTGDRHQRDAGAFFVKLLKQAKPWKLGLEYFDLPADFETELPVWSEDAQKVLRYGLIEDNDDRDEWPDIVEHWDPLDPLYITWDRAGIDVDAKTPETSADYGLSGGYGVYPGLDENADGTIDTNVNRNQFPDYAEPFFMYSVEPDEFVYGDDFDNNGVVDARENDNEPDYPYDRDQRGYHGFVSFNPTGRFDGRLGRYRVEQRAGDGESAVDYGELRYDIDHRWIGRFNLNYRLKRVRDDIPDPLYQHAFDQGTRATVAIRLRPDPLLMRNSLVNTLFAESRYSRAPGLNIVNAVKYERNGRRSEAAEIDGDVVEYTLMSKADYTYKIGDLTLTPMAKFRLYKRNCPGRLLAPLHTYETFPIFKLDYALSPRTFFRIGLQGIPGFQHRYRDKKAPSANFDASHFIAVIQNSSNYTGYDLSINLGFRRSRSRLVALPDRRIERFTEFFIQARVL